MNAQQQEQVENLTQLLSTEMDAAMVEAGILKPHEVIPFDSLAPSVQAVVRCTAIEIYKRLAFDSNTGSVVVIPKTGV